MNILEEFEMPSLEEFSDESYYNNTNNFINEFNNYIDELDNEELNDLKFPNDYSEEDYDNEEYLYYDEIYSNIELSNEYYNNYNKLEDYINISGIISNKVIKDINPDISKEDLNNQVNNNINYIMDKVLDSHISYEEKKGNIIINGIKAIYRAIINFIKNIGLFIRKKILPVFGIKYKNKEEREEFEKNIDDPDKNKVEVGIKGVFKNLTSPKAGEIAKEVLAGAATTSAVVVGIGKLIDFVSSKMSQAEARGDGKTPIPVPEQKQIESKMAQIFLPLQKGPNPMVNKEKVEDVITSIRNGRVPNLSALLKGNLNSGANKVMKNMKVEVSRILSKYDWELMNPTNISKLSVLANKLKQATRSVNRVFKPNINTKSKAIMYRLGLVRQSCKGALTSVNQHVKKYMAIITFVMAAHKAMRIVKSGIASKK